MTAFIVFITGLICGMLPLLLSSGRNLEYEYASLSAILMLLILPLVWSRRAQLKKERFSRLLSTAALAICGAFLPGLFLFMTGLCPCGFYEYLFWMGIQLIPSTLLACGVGSLIRSRTSASQDKRPQFIYWTVIILLACSEIILCLWMLPQKRITHWLSGFLHGPVYDAWITADAGILLIRISHAVIGVTLLLLSVQSRSERRRLLQGSCGIMLWLLLRIMATQFPGGSSGSADLRTFLSETQHGPGFVVCYAPDKDPEKQRSYKLIAQQTAFHLAELKASLGLKNIKKEISIYVYPDQKQKKLWSGSGQTDVTDVYGPSIHITAETGAHSTLRHELVHAVSSEFAWGGLGFHPDMALTEGLAVALAPGFSTITPDEGAAAVLMQNPELSLSRLFSPFFFWTEAPARAYTIAGSFFSWVLRHYGADHLKRLYRGEDPDDVLSPSAEEAEKRWKREILQHYDNKKQGLIAHSLYRRPGLLFQSCPHTAALYKDPDQDLISELRRPPGWQAKKDYPQWEERIHGQETWFLSRQLHSQARKLLTQSNVPAENTPSSDEARQKILSGISALTRFPPESLEEISLLLLKSDLLHQSDTAESNEILIRLRDFIRQRNPGPAMIRQIYSRLAVNRIRDQQQQNRWRFYLAGWLPPGEIPLPHPDALWITRYLLIRWQAASKSSHHSGAELKALRRVMPEKDLPAELTEQWLFTLGNISFHQQEWLLASDFFRDSSDVAGEGRIQKYLELSRLAAFLAGQNTPHH
ncbi:MAG: hypothetical protein H6618_09905 [Deltaproteobacteria bacterium]|nr:hypothetical protein [Deltaproteobacteria bacterium]